MEKQILKPKIKKIGTLYDLFYYFVNWNNFTTNVSILDTILYTYQLFTNIDELIYTLNKKQVRFV